MLVKEKKEALVKEYGAAFGKGEKDSGCAAVQIAILTTRINELKGHFGKHIHDYHSNRGLLKMIGKRKKLLKYVQANSADQYKELIGKLGLRK